MIDWFLNLTWVSELLLVVAALAYLSWAASFGFVLGLMSNDSGALSTSRTLLNCVLFTIFAPFILAYILICYRMRNNDTRS